MQCIPTPLAWFLHALPSVFLKLAVAATLLIELPAPFLLLAPFRAARLAGAALQAALQALIVLSGNYNFFNLLTGCLALTLLDDDVAWVSGRRAPRRSAGPAWTWTAFTALGPLGFVHAAVEGSRALGLAVVLGVLGAGAGAMFAFEAPAGPDGRGFDVALTLTSDALTGIVGRALLPVLYAWGVVLVLGTGADILSAQSDNIGAPGVREDDKVVPAVGLRQLVHGHDLLGHELHHHLRERGAAHAPALQQGPHPLAARQLVRISGSAGSRTAGTSAPRRASTSRASGR